MFSQILRKSRNKKLLFPAYESVGHTDGVGYEGATVIDPAKVASNPPSEIETERRWWARTTGIVPGAEEKVVMGVYYPKQHLRLHTPGTRRGGGGATCVVPGLRDL